MSDKHTIERMNNLESLEDIRSIFDSQIATIGARLNDSPPRWRYIAIEKDTYEAEEYRILEETYLFLLKKRREILDMLNTLHAASSCYANDVD